MSDPRHLVLCLATACVMWQPSVAGAQENWPRFRGADATGVAPDDPRLPEVWDQQKNVQWSTPIPGWGWSSPIVWGDRVFVTSVHSDEEYERPKAGLYLGRGVRDAPDTMHHWMVYCLDLHTGEIRWKHEAHRGKPKVPRHPKNTYASETPTTDGKRLYVLFGDVGLYCYDLDGEQLWDHAIEPKETFWDYGAAASPIVHGDHVIFIYDNQETSFIAALDTRTGQQRWRTERDETSTWATPFVWQHEGRTEIVTAGRKVNRSYSIDGQLLWYFDGQMSGLTIPSPFAVDGLLYITSGYFQDRHKPVYAIAPGAAGDIALGENETANDFIRWYQPLAGPYNTSPIVYQGLYITLLDRGMITCHDAKTGKEIYGRRRFPQGASFTASPWAYNGKLFFLSEDGRTFVVPANRQFEVQHTNVIDDLCIATPSMSQGRLLLRTASKVYCISNQGAAQ